MNLGCDFDGFVEMQVFLPCVGVECEVFLCMMCGVLSDLFVCVHVV